MFQLPLSLLKTAQSHPMVSIYIKNPWKFLVRDLFISQLVELKNGETYNGHLVSCDTWMNINLREVICTSKDGDKFWRMPECYIRGSTIKYLRIPDEVIDMVKEDVQQKARNRTEVKNQRNQQNQNKNRGQGGQQGSRPGLGSQGGNKMGMKK